MVVLASLIVQASRFLGFTVRANDAVPGRCDYKWMTQSVDHFGSSNVTFSQRYSIFTRHFRPGGPILFFQGEESTFLDCADTTIMMWFAERLGGLAVSLEHRYFGQSLPFGNESYTNVNLKLLTLENVMADAVSFVEMLRSTVVGANNSECIVASGSYGGLLAMAFRQNHPATFFASLAAAGPNLAVSSASTTTQPEQFLFRDYASQSYMDRSKEASEKIKNALTLVEDAIKFGNTAELQQGLQLCIEPPTHSSESIMAIQQLYVAAFSSAVEFNYAVASPGRTPVARPFDLTIDIALKAKSSMELLNNSLRLWYEPQRYKCIDWANISFVQQLSPLIQWTPWRYICCTYVPLCVGPTSEGTIFPSLEGTCLQQQAYCTQTFNATLLSQQQFWSQYHLSTEALNNSTRIIFSVAEFDPTTAIVGANPPLTGNVCRSRRLYTSGMAHREELFYPRDGDKPEVVNLRKKELQIIKEWLAYCT